MPAGTYCWIYREKRLRQTLAHAMSKKLLKAHRDDQWREHDPAEQADLALGAPASPLGNEAQPSLTGSFSVEEVDHLNVLEITPELEMAVESLLLAQSRDGYFEVMQLQPQTRLLVSVVVIGHPKPPSPRLAASPLFVSAPNTARLRDRCLQRGQETRHTVANETSRRRQSSFLPIAGPLTAAIIAPPKPILQCKYALTDH